MKNRILFLPLLAIVSITFWAGKPQGKEVKAKTMEKNFVSVGEMLFAAKYEVSNIDYKEFLASLKDEPARYQELNIQSERWADHLKFADPVEDAYSGHPAFHNYPVVNITYEGAQAYCAWLTELYHSDEKRTYKKVVFRLPTAEEWEKAAQAGDENANYAWGGPSLHNAKGQYLCNFRVIHQQMISHDENGQIAIVSNAGYDRSMGDHYSITAPVHAFPSNDFGLHNVCGNVAEMLSTEGVARGGSWKDLGYDVRIQSERNYTEPSPYVGFRVFMEVIEE